MHHHISYVFVCVYSEIDPSSCIKHFHVIILVHNHHEEEEEDKRKQCLTKAIIIHASKQPPPPPLQHCSTAEMQDLPTTMLHALCCKKASQ